jgi:hypothetical protein
MKIPTIKFQKTINNQTSKPQFSKPSLFVRDLNTYDIVICLILKIYSLDFFDNCSLYIEIYLNFVT